MDSKDDTYRKLYKLRNNHDIVILASDKESISILMNKKDYTDKVDRLISEGINSKKYCATEDTTLKDLKNFQSFLYINFKNHKDYKEIYPFSHQPTRFFATAKTHKFSSLTDINLDELKLRPIIDQTGTCHYMASKFMSKYSECTPEFRNVGR